MALSSCVPVAQGVAVPDAAALPPVKRFTGAPAATPRHSRAELARDFLDLTFALENGQDLPILTRFEGPVTIAVERVGSTPLPPTLMPDLTELIARLRAEAGIDIGQARPGEAASITVSVLPLRELQRVVPGAACFVVPRVAGWAAFRRAGRDRLDWTTLTERRRATVVLPSDVPPQEIRDCLHEEVAQALGPLGDLFRVPHSIFNDDNMHVVLTDRDMALLRAAYDPRLRSGMTRAQVTASMPTLLDRPAMPRPDAGGWAQAVRQAMDPARSDRARTAAAKDAVRRAASTPDERLALSYLVLGRAALTREPGTALDAFMEAAARYRRLAGRGIHDAQIATQLAAFALSSGDPDAALRTTDGAIPAADGAQNAGVLATLLLLRAEALDLKGQSPMAARVRREGLAWGRYAWGDGGVGARAAEVAALAPGA